MNYLIDPEFFLLFARVTVAVIMLYFGWPKLKKPQDAFDETQHFGFKPAQIFGSALIFTEIVGGLGLLLGIYAEIAAALIGYEMIVGTFWKIKTKKGFGNWSYDVLILGMCLIVIGLGAGPYQIIPFELPWFRWDILGAVVLLGLGQTFMPEILGERYRQWGEKKK